jgi:hypothetical protein
VCQFNVTLMYECNECTLLELTLAEHGFSIQFLNEEPCSEPQTVSPLNIEVLINICVVIVCNKIDGHYH